MSGVSVANGALLAMNMHCRVTASTERRVNDYYLVITCLHFLLFVHDFSLDCVCAVPTHTHSG